MNGHRSRLHVVTIPTNFVRGNIIEAKYKLNCEDVKVPKKKIRSEMRPEISTPLNSVTVRIGKMNVLLDRPGRNMEKKNIYRPTSK